MNINITHIAVYAKDLGKSKDYYVTYFNGKSSELYINAEGFSSYFISFDRVM